MLSSYPSFSLSSPFTLVENSLKQVLGFFCHLIPFLVLLDISWKWTFLHTVK